MHGGSRYPDQEFCLVDPTLLRELFGCADDQREKCSDQTSCQNLCVDDGSGDTLQGCVNNCECAGSLDLGLRDSHSDYLTGDWQTLQDKFYGDDTDSSHKCSHPEIMIANALSNYLDVADLDIRTACSQAKERFEAASRAYQVFVDPSKFNERVNDQLQPNIYTVLREAWRQAEFTLRSSKIQEQTLDRIRKYQDYIEYQLANGKQGLKTDLIGTKGINDDVGPDGTIEDGTGSTLWSNDKTQSKAFRTFRTAFDNHVKQYIVLSHNENEKLKSDLDDAIAEIDKAKTFAQELAATQISASTSLATVSVHFRKKLQLWMNIENTLEKSIGNAFDSEKQTESEHLMANMATHQVPIPGTISINSKEAEIAEGEAYNGAGSRDEENVELDITTTLPADHITIIRMSNGKVVTSLDCDKCSVGNAEDEETCIGGGVCSHGITTNKEACEAEGSCDYSSFTTQAECEANGDTWAVNTWVTNVWTGDNVCDVYDYKDELHPLQERDAVCESQKCVLPAAEGSFQTMQDDKGDEQQIIKDYKIDGAKYNREKPSSAGGGALVDGAPKDSVNGVAGDSSSLDFSARRCSDETINNKGDCLDVPGNTWDFQKADAGGTSALEFSGNIEGRPRRLCNLCQWS